MCRSFLARDCCCVGVGSAIIGCNGAMPYSHASRDNGRSVDERMDAQRASVVDITSHTKPSQTR
jgi:hypothetical protein